MPILSVVAPVEFAVQASEQSILSMLAQLPQDTELILVSFKNSHSLSSDFSNWVRQQQQVRCFESAPSRAAGFEAGRLNASGLYLMYLDALSLPSESYIENACRYLDEHTACDAVAAPGSALDRSALLLNPDVAVHGWVVRRARWDLLGPWMGLPISTAWEYLVRAWTQGFVAAASTLGETPSFEPKAWQSRRLYDQSAVADYLQALAIQAGRVVELVDAFLPTLPDQGKADRVALSLLLFRYGRACARHQLSSEARAFLSMSIRINQRKTLQHRAYIKLVRLLGWQRAAQLLRQ
ncbi:hypothetical protein GCM10008090_04710 [Arenicella chitinivorans]|uniref:Glycosyltransferase n=1 Tax=Arenicella chitinivorans TaxID=1329800 RepID=A0A918RL57_9GAMM|nr:glycosyltransferase family A protein [Arenicella chitinivorans]GGZ99192.1 hypothetical protein GCM10008090_04710 [Arenicella chitinivorans]